MNGGDMADQAILNKIYQDAQSNEYSRTVSRTNLNNSDQVMD